MDKFTYHIWNKAQINSLDFTQRYALENSYIPKYQWVEDTLLPADDADQFIRLREIRENLYDFLCSSTNNLVLCSKNLGNGKTSWAIKLMLTFIELQEGKLNHVDENEVNLDNFDFCVFCQSVPFLVKMKQFGNNKDTYTMFNRLCKTQLAIIDDLGVVPMSQYDYNIIYAILEERIFSGKPTIVTTNFVRTEEAAKELGVRLADRLWNNSEIIEFKNRGFRGV